MREGVLFSEAPSPFICEIELQLYKNVDEAIIRRADKLIVFIEKKLSFCGIFRKALGHNEKLNPPCPFQGA